MADKHIDGLKNQLPETLRPGITIDWLEIPPSSPDTTGFKCPMVKNIPLTSDEAKALGLIPIGGNLPKVDLIILSYNEESPTEQEMWQNLISAEADGAELYRNLAGSIMPELKISEISADGLHVNGQSTRDARYSPHNVFLQAYLQNPGSNILLCLGHSYGAEVSFGQKVMGSDYNSDTFDHLMDNIDTSNYSVILDTTCTNPDYVPEKTDYTPLIISARRPTVFKGHPTEEQCESLIISHGEVIVINWLSILQTRRQLGQL